ncbi:hypothetical protein [Rufibacter aurantiacus]|uniref:hypothetical protein n=1 Tax=Rufibacter aurantiacus TaxID=2817374 RepID=UPI001B302F57|nr:hypothetical protein [Rufibacter aurantiacus]
MNYLNNSYSLNPSSLSNRYFPLFFMPIIKVTIGTTNLQQNHINISTHDNYLFEGNHTNIFLHLGDYHQGIERTINREVNEGGTLRIMTGAEAGEWISNRFAVGATMNIDVIANNRVRLLEPVII